MFRTRVGGLCTIPINPSFISDFRYRVRTVLPTKDVDPATHLTHCTKITFIPLHQMFLSLFFYFCHHQAVALNGADVSLMSFLLFFLMIKMKMRTVSLESHLYQGLWPEAKGLFSRPDFSGLDARWSENVPNGRKEPGCRVCACPDLAYLSLGCLSLTCWSDH